MLFNVFVQTIDDISTVKYNEGKDALLTLHLAKVGYEFSVSWLRPQKEEAALASRTVLLSLVEKTPYSTRWKHYSPAETKTMMTTTTTTAEKTGKSGCRHAFLREEESQMLENCRSVVNEFENLVKGADWENIGLIMMTDTVRLVSSSQNYETNVKGDIVPKVPAVSYALSVELLGTLLFLRDATATARRGETLIETTEDAHYVQNVVTDLLGSDRPHILTVDGPDDVPRLDFEGDSGVVVLNSWNASTASLRFPR